MGTVGYMAPEQVRGAAVDARTDLFAFGAVLYEILSGQRAFRRDTAAETMTAILREDPPSCPPRARSSHLPSNVLCGTVSKRIRRSAFRPARDVAFALEAFSGTSVSGVAVATAPPARTLVAERCSDGRFR
jgi:serine/threonine protein kinase